MPLGHMTGIQPEITTMNESGRLDAQSIRPFSSQHPGHFQPPHLCTWNHLGLSACFGLRRDCAKSTPIGTKNAHPIVIKIPCTRYQPRSLDPSPSALPVARLRFRPTASDPAWSTIASSGPATRLIATCPVSDSGKAPVLRALMNEMVVNSPLSVTS